MKFKKVLSSILVAAMTMGMLSGCGSTTTTTPGTSGNNGGGTVQEGSNGGGAASGGAISFEDLLKAADQK